MRNEPKPCPVCGQRDCKGQQETDPVHEYRGKGSWCLGCHCPGCSQARDESGGFMGALADHMSGGSRG
ncbi:hypothetical protein HNR03_004019 [Pseudomonas sp. JAI111]|nr:hypothetical protein [Pseudomonas sp. JAI111]